MIYNIVDHRTNRLDININAIFEPSSHDDPNLPAGSFTIEELFKTTVNEAISFASKWNEPVTLYIYDIT